MRSREFLLTVLVGIALTIVLTWPIAARFADAGRVDTGDGRFSIWNVAWVAHALTTNPWQLFNANIFYPHQNTLAYSEANLVAGIMAIPVWLATQNAQAASNWVILCSFLLSFLATYALVRHLTGHPAASAMAGLVFAFCPFVLSHLPHVQLLMTFVLPLVLLRMHRFVAAPDLRQAGWLGGAVGLAGLSCAYYGVFAGLMAALGIVWFGAWNGHWRRWQYWGLAAGAAGVSLLVIAPFFAPYVAVRAEGFERTLDDARTHSVLWRSYLASPVLLHQWLLPVIGTWREVLFPGYIALVFGPYAVWRAFRKPQPSGTRRLVGFYVLLGAWAYWASLGPDGWLYWAMHETLPVFSMLRAPARFGLLVTLALAVMAGVGLARAPLVTAAGRPSLVALIAIVLAATRLVHEPLYVAPAPEPSEAHKRLVSLPMAPVVEFPFYVGGARHQHTEYMLLSTRHWKPLVNGYSDHFPAEAHETHPRLATFPDLDAWQVMRDHRVRYVLVHWYRLEHTDNRRIRAGTIKFRPQLRLVVEGTDVSLYEIVSWPTELN